ncbi:MAG: hypothetical protein ACK46X_15580 [Candidatus Sericytochromatia bacterium]
MMNPINYRLPQAPAAPKKPAAADDYARRHAEAFGAKLPPKAPSGDKLSLGWQLDEATRLNLKPSLKKGGTLKVELKIKF